jgi:cytochrome c oxidase subunit 2
MKSLSSLERKVFFASVAVMTSFCLILGFTAWRYGIDLPGCVTDVQPFDVGRVIERGEKDYEVHMVAKMWAFDPPIINLPRGSRVRFYLSAKDVNHGFHIDKTNVNLMAVPGAVNYGEAVFNETGKFRVVCHEYCGSGHQNMAGMINVTDEMPAEIVPTTLAANAVGGKGGQHLQTYGCVACHTTDGSPGVGPTFKGLFGRLEQFEDGTSQKVDEQFIAEYIRNPNFKVIKGYAPTMPKLPVAEEHVAEIVDFIKTIN